MTTKPFDSGFPFTSAYLEHREKGQRIYAFGDECVTFSANSYPILDYKENYFALTRQQALDWLRGDRTAEEILASTNWFTAECLGLD